MDFNSKLPKHSKILVLGGGIHGVGILHDLLSRGWKDVHLLEKKKLASGTSSRSTKLIHGGFATLLLLRKSLWLVNASKKENYC